MQESIVVQDKKISIGSTFYGTNSAESRGICRRDELLTVKIIKIEEQPYIGLYSEHIHKGWGDLGDLVAPGHGYWQSAEGLFRYFELTPNDRIVTGDFCYKKRNLNGMKCKVLYEDRRNCQCFVELDKNVNGGCCDGLGKTGHCIAIPSAFLSDVEDKESSKSKSKKKEGVQNPDKAAIFDFKWEFSEKGIEVGLGEGKLSDGWRAHMIGHPAEVNEFKGIEVVGKEVKYEPIKATLSEYPAISDEEIGFFEGEAEDPSNGDWTHYEQIVEHKIE